MGLYDEHVLEPFQEGLERLDKGIPIPMPKLAKFANYIERGQNVMRGGKQTSGKTSLMDYMYLINAFIWWESLDKEDRPPLKIFYFNMRSSTRLKLQKWACLYLKLKYDIVIDIPTLNNGIGKLYDVSEDKKRAIEIASLFFNNLEDILILSQGPKTASDIYNSVARNMLDVGTIDNDGKYVLNPENSKQITIVCIDNLDCVIPESDGSSSTTLESTKKRMSSYINKFKDMYNITTAAVVPSVLANPRTFKDSEPTYKELGSYSSIADLGFITYNPYNEGNVRYLGYDVEDFIINAKNRMRTVTIVRNSKGVENITVASIFLGECGYFRELPTAEQTSQLDKFKELLHALD